MRIWEGEPGGKSEVISFECMGYVNIGVWFSEMIHLFCRKCHIFSLYSKAGIR